MLLKKELIFPLILLLLLAAVSMYLPVKYLGDYFFYRSLNKKGIKTEAVIKEKGILADGKFLFSGQTRPSDHHLLKFEYITESKEPAICECAVSKNVYDSSLIGGRSDIVSSETAAGKCYLPENARSLYIFSVIILSFGLVFLIIFAAVAVHIYRSFKKRKIPVKLSTKFSLTNELFCPECGSRMIEGYIPGVGGINWRERNEPVGLPNMLTGLPGTVFWNKRPILHAFNCKECGVITFKYNKK